MIITRNGKPQAVMMGFEEYESWVETLELMSRPETVRGIIAEGCESARDVARETLEEVRAAIGLGYR